MLFSRLRQSLPSLPPALLSLLGHRLSRSQILRLTFLLLCQLLLIRLSLPPPFSALLSSLFTTTLQTTLILATTASIFDFTGLLGALFSRWFAADAPFLDLLCVVLLVVGPLAYVAEAVTLAYESIRIAREMEARMYEEEEKRGGAVYRSALMFLAALFLLTTTLALFPIYLAHPYLAVVAAGLSVVIILISLVKDDANIVESTGVSLYITLVLLVALVEEAQLPTAFLIDHLVDYNPNVVKQLAAEHWQHVCAVVFIYAVIAILFVLIRGTRFLTLVRLGYEQMQQNERAAQGAPQTQQEQEQEEEIHAIAKHWNFGELAVILLSFRLLLWGGHIHAGEYLPMLCRLVQVLAAAGSYAIFVLGR